MADMAKTTEEELGELRRNAEDAIRRTSRTLRQRAGPDLDALIHELETHHVELEMQNEELRRARHDLEESQRSYADLFDFAPMAKTTEEELGELRRNAEDAIRRTSRTLRQRAGPDLDALIHELETHHVELEMQNEELRRARHDLEESQRSYADLFDFAPVGYLVLNDDGVIRSANFTAARLLGRDKCSIVGLPFSVFVVKGDSKIFFEHLANVFQRKARQSVELRVTRDDKSILHVQLQSDVAAEVENRPALCRMAVIDITDRKRTEEMLHSQEAELELVVSRTPFMLTRCSRDLRYRFVSRAYAEMLGRTPDQIAGRPIREIIGEHGFQTILPHIEAVLQGRVVGYEAEVHFKGVGPRWLRSTYVPDTDGQANVVGWIASIIDISERKRAEKAIQDSEERLRMHVENTPLAVIEWGPDFRLARWSSEAERIFGWKAEEVLGKRMDEFRWIFEEDAGAVARVAAGLRDGTCPRSASHNRNYRKDGSVVDCEWYNSSLMDEAGNLRSILSLVLDVTERKQAEEELAAAKAAAEQANRIKDDFLAVLSHEMRTPLTPVMMGVAMLQDRDDFDPAVRETVEMIRRSVEMEAHLIDDLLDVSRIARGKIELHKQRVDLCTAIQRAVEVCQGDIEAGGFHFELDMGRAAPYWVEADVSRLQQVFWNLLKNALKFTPHGGRIAVRCRPDADQVVAEVSDSGIGIEPKALARIFNAFEQQQRAITQQFGGLGLGLAISKALVEMHGGTIEAGSGGRNKGSSFRIRLPLAMPGPHGQARRPSVDLPVAVRPLRVLLVEDHPVTAKLMQMVLTAGGHTVQCASEVAAAIDLAGRGEFDLLMSDLGLPDGSGHDLIRQLRERGYAFPGIALSGYGQEEDIRRSYEAGFAAHLTKPASREAVFQVIAWIMESEKSGASLEHSGAQ